MVKTLARTAAAALLLALISMALLLAQPPTLWVGWQPATCLETHCFCEAANPLSPIRQPANSVSSLLYLLPACAILGLARVPRPPARRFPPVYAILLAIAALVTGLGSAFYHASLTFAGQFFDILGMLLLSSLMLVYALERSLSWPTRQTLAVYAAANALLILIQVALPDTRRYLFAIVLLLALLVEYRLQVTHRTTAVAAWLNTGLAVFALAFGIWILDQTGALCSPTSWLQGHALWHLLGAAGVGLLYLYYSSEQ